MVTEDWQVGHFVFLPDHFRGARSLRPHLQLKTISRRSVFAAPGKVTCFPHAGQFALRPARLALTVSVFPQVQVVRTCSGDVADSGDGGRSVVEVARSATDVGRSVAAGLSVADAGLSVVVAELAAVVVELSVTEVGRSLGAAALSVADVAPSLVIASELPQAGHEILNPTYFCETDKSCPQEQ